MSVISKLPTLSKLPCFTVQILYLLFYVRIKLLKIKLKIIVPVLVIPIHYFHFRFLIYFHRRLCRRTLFRSLHHAQSRSSDWFSRFPCPSSNIPFADSSCSSFDVLGCSFLIYTPYTTSVQASDTFSISNILSSNEVFLARCDLACLCHRSHACLSTKLNGYGCKKRNGFNWLYFN